MSCSLWSPMDMDSSLWISSQHFHQCELHVCGFYDLIVLLDYEYTLLPKTVINLGR